MFCSTGTVKYRAEKNGLWVTVYVDQQLADYYLSLIPKRYGVIKPGWKAHVTVARPEEISDLKNWRKRDNEKVEFVYDPTLLEEKNFWWFNLWSKEMEEIRLELGLSIKSRITIPPAGYIKCFHCTVGVMK